MRTDMESMNPGKAMAQAAHAANEAVAKMEWIISDSQATQMEEWLKEWKDNRAFGTTIVLAAKYSDFSSVKLKSVDAGLLFSEVFDPTYPVKDGEVTHLIPIVTCAYVFGPVDKCQPVVANMQLHP